MLRYGNGPHWSPMPLLTMGLFLKTIRYSEYIDRFRCKELKITRSGNGLIQFDGESKMMGSQINVSVLSHAVNAIVPTASCYDLPQ